MPEGGLARNPRYTTQMNREREQEQTGIKQEFLESLTVSFPTSQGNLGGDGDRSAAGKVASAHSRKASVAAFVQLFCSGLLSRPSCLPGSHNESWAAVRCHSADKLAHMYVI